MTKLLKTLCALIMMTSMACVRADDTSDKAAAVATLEGFFAAFSVEHYPNPSMGDWITDDFLIFEMGEVFTWPSFQAFLAGAGYADWISTDWQFSELRVSVSGQAAHISYVNEGEFIYPDPANPEGRLRERNRWLESVYLVKQDGRFKIKFLQSDNVTREVAAYP